MSKFERIKQKIRENKGKIILGCISVAGVIYVITKQNGKIKLLESNVKLLSDENETLCNDVETLNNDVRVLKGVITENVLANMKQCLMRQLRYNEGRLNNGLKTKAISEADIKLREEAIESIGKELLKIDEAYEVLSK